ncbi:MAG: hypothetical protein CK532_01770 [Flavobacteriales bacterium]|nr:MAG: hypothetical protein CK532_01770 [Flavobacteriales bacterium]
MTQRIFLESFRLFGYGYISKVVYQYFLKLLFRVMAKLTQVRGHFREKKSHREQYRLFTYFFATIHDIYVLIPKLLANK